uniref:DUF6598 domain-containing protein n=1 Tax=Leersia perrieri TaxID=77586 RepID=A0A0D9XPF1_9ORYZ
MALLCQGNILLTGPSLATSAYGHVIFNLCLHEDSQEDEDIENNGRIFNYTCDGKFYDYNRAIVKSVSTRYSPAEVTYVVLTNVVQECKDSWLVRYKDEHGDPIVANGIHGRIVTHSKLLNNVRCVLFCDESGGSMHVGPGGLIPLVRQACACRASYDANDDRVGLAFFFQL